MPLDYSKWDALELSDDSDIEVHPNVDKKSFIRAKQNQIHQERQQRKANIETLKYERVINDELARRIADLLASLKEHASEAEKRNPGEVAFQAVMQSAAKLDPKADHPPPRPAGVHGAEEPLPSYSKMMATLLDQVNQALDEKKVEQDKRYGAMMTEIESHLTKVTDLQAELVKKLAELEQQDSKKITSESYRTGFDSSHVSKAKPRDGGQAASSSSSQVELLNPNFKFDEKDSTGLKQSDNGDSKGEYEDDDADEAEASPEGKQFAKIQAGEYRESAAFLAKHPQILTERETDGLLVLAFDAALSQREDEARNCVHQALLLQYCRALGRDGVALFFKRITTPGHKAQAVFHNDVRETFERIRSRALEIVAQRAREGAEGGGVEQIQLHAVEPGTVINIRVPPAGSEDPAVQRARAIFEGFKPEMRRALETGSLDEVNKELGKMGVEEAEELVGQFGEAGVLSLEDEIIDATTEAGQEKLKSLEKEALEETDTTETTAPATTSESQYADDPE